ncbi:PucR family transcriptional regulator [Vallicoccus soli]|uniref:PucR family transcriptional regulator n=1 Tax=Vallicoccus soli TaxID=2339232 RepID=A0A3A3Z1Q3_9ACTN|nr:PucR family transcriptional regulator [Vallicoccus soli]
MPPSGTDLPAPVTGGLSVAEVLGTAVLGGAQVLAGVRGLGRTVTRLNVMEVPDILPWVKPQELLLTTGYPLRGEGAGAPADPRALVDLVAALDDRGLAALGVKLGRYLDAVPAEVLAEADRRGFPVVRLPDDVAFDDVLEQVLTELLNRQAAVLARGEQVQRALVEAVLDGGGVPEVVGALVRILGGAVLVTTADGRVLADAGSEAALEAAYGSDCFEGTGRFRTERERPGAHGHPGMRGNHVVVPVVAAGVEHGRIVAHSPAGALGEDDVHVLERAATVAALALTRQLAVRAVESKYQGDFLRDALAGRVDPEAAVSHAAALGWDLDRPLVVVVAELDPPPDDADPALGLRPVIERFTAAWQSVVRPVDPHAPVVGFTQEVVALLGVPEDGDVERRVRELVRAVSGDGGGGRRPFSTGVGRVAATPAALGEAYEQARTAVRVGRRTHGPGATAHFDGLGVFRLLSLVDDQRELDAFVAEVLGPLARPDDADARDLLRTLEVLLETGLNVAETARLLHFHYNTLRYRIAKLERLLGPFTSDHELRLGLMLALRILVMRGSG